MTEFFILLIWLRIHKGRRKILEKRRECRQNSYYRQRPNSSSTWKIMSLMKLYSEVFPPNATTILQPMDDKIIEKLTKVQNKNSAFFFCWLGEESVMTFTKNYKGLCIQAGLCLQNPFKTIWKMVEGSCGQLPFINSKLKNIYVIPVTKTLKYMRSNLTVEDNTHLWKIWQNRCKLSA